MKTPKETKELAKKIAKFCKDKNIPISVCQSQELAAIAEGSSSLHHRQKNAAKGIDINSIIPVIKHNKTLQEIEDAETALGLKTPEENFTFQGEGEIKIENNKLVSTLDKSGIQTGPAIDGMESFLLALQQEGVEVNTPAVKRAIQTTLDAIYNNFQDEPTIEGISWAICNCSHTINAEQIILKYNPNAEGRNALHQLNLRLEELFKQ